MSDAEYWFVYGFFMYDSVHDVYLVTKACCGFVVKCGKNDDYAKNMTII